MTAKNDVWMPLFVADYLKDTRHLSCTEHGAYLQLLMHAWTNGGAIPASDARLAIVTGLSPRQWKPIKPVVLGFWQLNGDGQSYTHKRVEQELERARRVTEERSKSGRKGAANRWQKDSKRHDKAMANSMANPSQNDGPSPSPSSVSKDTGAEAPSIDPDKKAWQDGVAVLVQHGGMKEPAARSLFGKLIRDGGFQAKDLLPAITQAMANQTQDPAAYLRKAAEGMAKRRAGGSAAPAPADEITRDDWIRRVGMFRKDGMWLGSWGPRPGERGCICPADLLEG